VNLPRPAAAKSLVARRSTDVVAEVIGAFESDTTAVILRTAPRRQGSTIQMLAAIILCAFVFACIAKVDRVVTSLSGIILTSQGTLYVSPLNPSLVRSLDVKAGQIVKKGQRLATLDPTFTQADLLQMQERMASDEAVVAREHAEIEKRPYEFSTTDKYQNTQGELWLKRQAQFRSDLANFDSQIHSIEAQMSQATSDSDKYRERLRLATEAEKVYAPLLDKGYVSKLQMMQSTDTKTEMSRLLADAQNAIRQYRESAGALRAQRESYIHKWYADLNTQLTADQNDLEATRDSLAKNQKLQDLTSLDSPADAVVLQVGKLSPGSVAPGNGSDAVTPGSNPMFVLAPLNAPIEAELDIATSDVGFVSLGDPAQLKLDTFPYVLYGLARGVVTSISAGSFSVDQNNTPVAPYFKVKVKVTKLEFHDVPANVRLAPGMTLVGDVVVGRRTIMSYLSESLLRQGKEAMREPQ
jgi:HlyD family type I secretion membrane fusion protein